MQLTEIRKATGLLKEYSTGTKACDQPTTACPSRDFLHPRNPLKFHPSTPSTYALLLPERKQGLET